MFSVGEVAKSMLRLPWAMSLFSAGELANTLMPTSHDPQARPGTATDVVTQAIVEQLGVQGIFQGAFQGGDELQRELVDVLSGFLTPASLTSSSFIRLPADLLRWFTEVSRCFLPGRESLLIWQDLRNKIEVFALVPSVPSRLHLQLQPPFPSLIEAVRKAYAMEPYSALWAVEGLGHWYGDTFWQRHEIPRQILGEEHTGDIPTKSLLMLHAGIGLSFAQHYMQTVNHLSSHSDIRRVLQQIITLCRENSRSGYEGAALESLGLVTQSATFTGDARPDVLVRIVSQLLADIDPDVLGYFWHGVGRATYFLPIHFVPCYGSLWHAIEMVRQEASDEFAWHNALAGLAWGVTMVNIRQPQVMAHFLQCHGQHLGHNNAFSYGVTSSLMMRFDTTPDAPFIAPFYHYQPDSSDRVLTQLWYLQVQQPSERALHDYYPVLKRHDRLGEIFRYQPMPTLISRLEQAAA